MKQSIIAGLAAILVAGGLLHSAPGASAGCQPGAPFAISKCDGPVQPDGTWQRCVTFQQTSIGLRDSPSSYLTNTNCQTVGPDQHPWGLAFVDPPTHIDD
jgi:hypothetical protein